MIKIRKVFNKQNPYWKGSAEVNRYFLKACQDLSNRKLQGVGYILLNDVYDFLGFETTDLSCTHGWIFDKTENSNVKFSFERIGKTSSFEITFECYEILHYIPKEDGVVE